MPNLFLYELTAENRFKCRLAGSAIRQAFGREPTGKFLDELVDPANVAERTALFRSTLDKELPVVYGGRLAEGEHRWMPFKRLLLPVEDDQETSRFVFGMVNFVRVDDPNHLGGDEHFEAWATASDLKVNPDS